MIGFILAAGFGTRLLPLTGHLPKALVSVCGIPLLKRTNDFLRRNGIERCAVNAHHLPEQIEQFVKTKLPHMRIFTEHGAIRGTGGAFLFAKEYLGSDDSFCVANVDIVTNADIARLGREFLDGPAVVGLVAAPSENGTLRYKGNTGEFAGTRSRRERSVQKASRGPEKSADFIGISFYRKEFLSLLSDDDFDIIPVWDRAREKGMKVIVLETGAVYWNDVGTPKCLARVHFDVIDGRVKIVPPASMVVDHKGKKAYPGSFDPRVIERLGPYSWIDAAEVPDESTFSKTVVFPDAIVPNGVRIENAIVTKYGVISFDP
jgi:NDP-sugar pyrophosphorylase family protein